MKVVVRYLPIAILLAAWELSSRLGWVPPSLLPAVSDVASHWWLLVQKGDMFTHAAVSMFREIAGLSLSIVVGMTIGIMMAISKKLERLIQPLITFLYPLPKSALIPIIMIWLGLSHSAQIMVIFLGCLLPVVLSSFNGAKGVESVLVWSARSLGASPNETVFRVVVRAALPEIFAGIRVALALSFVLLVSVEMVGARQGMGFLISSLGEMGDYSGMFAVILTLVAIGFVADRMYLSFQQYMLRWREA